MNKKIETYEKIQARRKDYYNKYYDKNKKKILARQKQYYLDNKERLSDYRKEYRQNNLEKVRAQAKKSYDKYMLSLIDNT